VKLRVIVNQGEGTLKTEVVCFSFKRFDGPICTNDGGAGLGFACVAFHDGIVIAALPCPSSRQVVGEHEVGRVRASGAGRSFYTTFYPAFHTSSYFCAGGDNGANL
jgi:hypothetical protein